jgi:two-component system, NarL family, invasion response regulator UvrY
MSNAPIRIILVDDHKLVRQSWKMLLENNPLFQIIADFDNGKSAIEEAPQLIPDVMLVDINMSPVNGFAVTEKLMETNPAIKIIGLSVNNQPKYAVKMMGLGAKGYLTKTSSLEEINFGIIEVHRGEIYICEEVKKNMPPSE